MADEQLAPEEGLDPNAAPVEGADEQPDPIAALATKMGWVPQDQFKDDPGKWKPAEDFILTGRDINRGLSKELRGMREQVERVGRTTSELMAQRLADQENHWKSVHARAVEEGNGELASRAVDEMVSIKAKAPSQETGEPQETAEFKQRNAEWFGKDDLATMRAMEVAESMRRMGKDIPSQLQAAERAVKKEFPELFKAPPKAAPGVQTGTSRNPTTTGRAKGFNDMPAESQKMARDYEKRHGIKPEEFAKSYWADEDKRQRRVG